MDEIDSVFESMIEASGLSKEKILSRDRKRPLPAIRWFIADELIRRGYSSVKASNAVQLNHATILYGRKAIKMMSKDKRWHEEYLILNKFREICK